MANLLHQLRELPGKMRGVRLAVAGASRVTGIWRRRSVRIGVFAATLGAFLGIIGAFNVGDIPLLRRTLYFAGAMTCGWLLAYAIMELARRMPGLASRRWVRLGLAAATVAPVMAVLVWASAHWLEPGGQPPAMLPRFVAVSFGMAIAMTLLALLVFRVAPARPAVASPRARFIDRLPTRLLGAEIWALQAEDHYLRVHTSRGDVLILMRLSDAIGELEGVEGAQTHRSWWVARAAIDATRRIDERAILTLKNGIEAPVSRTHLRTLRGAGWL